VKSCPAPIATIKLAAQSGFDGTLRLVSCPPTESGKTADAVKRGAGEYRLELLDAAGKRLDSFALTPGSTKIEANDLYGSDRAVFFVTSQSLEPCAGRSCGPTTQLVEIEGGKLRRVQATGKTGKAEDIGLSSSLARTWWLHPARSGHGSDIYEVLNPPNGDATGFRYAFENGRWVIHEGVLKKWTGEHAADTEAEFP
jgi:hypothetical protein